MVTMSTVEGGPHIGTEQAVAHGTQGRWCP